VKRCLCFLAVIVGIAVHSYADNPFIKHLYTADPAAMVYNDTFYVFTGHGVGSNSAGYVMNDWHIFSTTNMVDWHDYGAVMAYSVFSWSSGAAWAGQCIYNPTLKKFFWYCPVEHRTISGKAIGVVVSDKITGPYIDARAGHGAYHQQHDNGYKRIVERYCPDRFYR